jgi:hypothetical protein
VQREWRGVAESTALSLSVLLVLGDGVLGLLQLVDVLAAAPEVYLLFLPLHEA